MKVALSISGETDTLYITKTVRSEEELNVAINFFRDCKAEIGDEEVESNIEILADKIKLVSFLNWEKKND